MAPPLTPSRRLAFVAVDHGPRATLGALANRLPGTWTDIRGAELVVCGTSDSAEGRRTEAAARRAARRTRVPLVIIEDFPGNYSALAGGEPQLVFVESEFAARLARSKEPVARIEVAPCVRYDPLRRRLAELRRHSDKAEDTVLWIGQPETADSLETLKRLLPALDRHEVWFRAHPRDAGYARGAYAGLPLEDLTSHPLEECLERRPRLVVTQFSSVAIEAGFWGIPSLHALFPDVGGKRLAAKKGYSVPPWCEAGAAFVVVEEGDVESVLDRALRSAVARQAVVRCFDQYFQVDTDGGAMLIDLLYNQGLL